MKPFNAMKILGIFLAGLSFRDALSTDNEDSFDWDTPISVQLEPKNYTSQNYTYKYEQDAFQFTKKVSQWAMKVIAEKDDHNSTGIHLSYNFQIKDSGGKSEKPCGDLVVHRFFKLFKAFLENPDKPAKVMSKLHRVFWQPSLECLERHDYQQLEGGSFVGLRVACGDTPLLKMGGMSGGFFDSSSSNDSHSKHQMLGGASLGLDLLQGKVEWMVGIMDPSNDIGELKFSSTENPITAVKELKSKMKACARNQTLVIHSTGAGGMREIFVNSTTTQEVSDAVGYGFAFELGYPHTSETSDSGSESEETPAPSTPSSMITQAPSPTTMAPMPTQVPAATPTAPAPTTLPTTLPTTPVPTTTPIALAPTTPAPTTPVPTTTPIALAPTTLVPTSAPTTPEPTPAPTTSVPNTTPIALAPTTPVPTSAPTTPLPNPAPTTPVPTSASTTPVPTIAPTLNASSPYITTTSVPTVIASKAVAVSSDKIVRDTDLLTRTFSLFSTPSLQQSSFLSMNQFYELSTPSSSYDRSPRLLSDFLQSKKQSSDWSMVLPPSWIYQSLDHENMTSASLNSSTPSPTAMVIPVSAPSVTPLPTSLKNDKNVETSSTSSPTPMPIPSLAPSVTPSPTALKNDKTVEPSSAPLSTMNIPMVHISTGLLIVLVVSVAYILCQRYRRRQGYSLL